MNDLKFSLARMFPPPHPYELITFIYFLYIMSFYWFYFRQNRVLKGGVPVMSVYIFLFVG
jgi:hypothetical protein